VNNPRRGIFYLDFIRSVNNVIINFISKRVSRSRRSGISVGSLSEMKMSNDGTHKVSSVYVFS